MSDDKDLEMIVAGLVRHWGAPKVFTVLEGVTTSANFGKSSLRTDVPKKHKTTPVQIAERLSGNLKYKDEIVSLAREFENKRFLPRIADAKDFLENNGHDTFGLKDRTVAFRKVMLVLQQLSRDRLRSLRNDALHSGPMRLGPLSDEIEKASDRLRPDRQSRLALAEREEKFSSSS